MVLRTVALSINYINVVQLNHIMWWLLLFIWGYQWIPILWLKFLIILFSCLTSSTLINHSNLFFFCQGFKWRGWTGQEAACSKPSETLLQGDIYSELVRFSYLHSLTQWRIITCNFPLKIPRKTLLKALLKSRYGACSEYLSSTHIVILLNEEMNLLGGIT